MKNIPKGINWLSIWMILGSLFGIVVFTSFYFFNDNEIIIIRDIVFPKIIYLSYLAFILVFSLIVAFNMRKGVGWSWNGAIIISILSISINLIFSLNLDNLQNLFTVFIHILIIYYLFRPHIKAYFGKAEVTDSDIKKWNKDRMKIGNILIIFGIIFFVMFFIFPNMRTSLLILLIGVLMKSK